jgi:long-subunit fatty acid transport protein
LRVGIAYHTPTYYNLEIGYAGAMKTVTSHLKPGKDEEVIEKEAVSPYFEDYGINSWRFRTPSRLLTGVAVTLGNRAILSADYERSWYQTLRLQGSKIIGLDDVYKGYFKEVFKGNSTLRLGLEYYALPIMALRAGYIWSGSGIKDDYKLALTSRPLPTEQSYLTAGLGLHLSKTTYLDFAYQYGTTHYTSIQPFYVTETYDDQTVAYIESALFDTKTTNHNFILTLGFRF